VKYPVVCEAHLLLSLHCHSVGGPSMSHIVRCIFKNHTKTNSIEKGLSLIRILRAIQVSRYLTGLPSIEVHAVPSGVKSPVYLMLHR
jgi:hypothetical protein